MKKTKAFALILFIITLGSCRKEDGHLVPPTASSTYSFSLKVDGVTKKASTYMATIYQMNNGLQIIAQLPGTESINVMVNNVSVGTFDVANSGAVLSYSTDYTFTNSYLGGVGAVTITSITNDTITGTFQFVGTSTPTGLNKVISDGEFKCRYGKS